jgi:hypothetical protein
MIDIKTAKQKIKESREQLERVCSNCGCVMKMRYIDDILDMMIEACTELEILRAQTGGHDNESRALQHRREDAEHPFDETSNTSS